MQTRIRRALDAAAGALRRVPNVRNVERWRFLLIVSAAGAAALWTLAFGLWRFQRGYELLLFNREVKAAASPVLYRAPLPALAALVPATPAGEEERWHVLVRADGAMGDADARRLCDAWRATRGSRAVTWVALSEPVPACGGDGTLGGPGLVRVPAPALERVRAELLTARWVVLDRGPATPQAAFSARTAPPRGWSGEPRAVFASGGGGAR